MPMISVIMPAYNHEKYIGEAIESVINQSYTDFEFIIINDDSTDNTEKVIKGFSDKRISYFSQSNKGAAHTINRGLSLSKGKYISIINSDDVYHKNRLETLIENAENKDLLFLFTNTALINEHSDIITDKENKELIDGKNKLVNRYRNINSLVHTLLLGNISFSTSNFFFNRSILNSVKKFNYYRYTHDYDFILRTLHHYAEQSAFLDQYEYLFYRVHGENTINESRWNLQLEVLGVILKNLYFLLSDNKNREFIFELEKQYSDYFKNDRNDKHDLVYLINSINNSVINYSKSVDNKNDKALIDLSLERINSISEYFAMENKLIWKLSHPLHYLYLRLPLDLRESKSLSYLRNQYIKILKLQ